MESRQNRSGIGISCSGHGSEARPADRKYRGRMSIPVAVHALASKMEEYGWAYLLTVRDDQRPHVVAISPEWDGDVLVSDVGRGTAANAAARSSISLCFPPPDRDGYSLIVDGTAAVDGTTLRFSPTGAVLHRPAAPDFEASSEGCGSDCAPVT